MVFHSCSGWAFTSRMRLHTYAHPPSIRTADVLQIIVQKLCPLSSGAWPGIAMERIGRDLVFYKALELEQNSTIIISHSISQYTSHWWRHVSASRRVLIASHHLVLVICAAAFASNCGKLSTCGNSLWASQIELYVELDIYLLVCVALLCVTHHSICS